MSRAKPTRKLVSALIFLALVAGTTEVAEGCSEWCVARSTATTETLRESLKFFCRSGVDCRLIQPGGPCYRPDNLRAEVSYVFNQYYQQTKVSGGRCDYGGGPGGSSILTNMDPRFLVQANQDSWNPLEKAVIWEQDSSHETTEDCILTGTGPMPNVTWTIQVGVWATLGTPDTDSADDL
ncbi:hypothetical protein Ancab_015628 [Ancistrocladus abbreviatus]